MQLRIYRIVTSILLLMTFQARAQFAPSAGQPGTTAIHKDSSVFVAWASSCSVVRGWQDCSDHSLGQATAGDSSYATGMADGIGIVSLGDGGMATLTFNNPIANGPGWDFAVFENSFSASFLELAFVEVSSDGVNFYRFPSISLTQDTIQISAFGSVMATQIHNLAGKYEALYGTPFNLDDLLGTPGLDINHITHVRVIDVVGSITEPCSTYDSQGHKINDPWPTPFASSGFDLDAVGVINQNTTSLSSIIEPGVSASIIPNPITESGVLNIFLPANGLVSAKILNLQGQVVHSLNWGYCIKGMHSLRIDATTWNKGVYVMRVMAGQHSFNLKLIINEK
jgi:hypothetical protein